MFCFCFTVVVMYSMLRFDFLLEKFMPKLLENKKTEFEWKKIEY